MRECHLEENKYHLHFVFLLLMSIYNKFKWRKNYNTKRIAWIDCWEIGILSLYFTSWLFFFSSNSIKYWFVCVNLVTFWFNTPNSRCIKAIAILSSCIFVFLYTHLDMEGNTILSLYSLSFLYLTIMNVYYSSFKVVKSFLSFLQLLHISIYILFIKPFWI